MSHLPVRIEQTQLRAREFAVTEAKFHDDEEEGRREHEAGRDCQIGKERQVPLRSAQTHFKDQR